MPTSPTSAILDSILGVNQQGDLQTSKDTVYRLPSLDYTFKPKQPGVTDFECLLKVTATSGPIRGTAEDLCQKRIHVGWEPLPVTSLKCSTDNLKSLSCRWDVPWNPVTTTYFATLKPTRVQQETKHFFIYKGQCRQPCRGCPGCEIDGSSIPPFNRRDALDGLYTLTINGSNPLVPHGVVWVHTLDLNSAMEALAVGGGGRGMEVPLDTNTRRGFYKEEDLVRATQGGVRSWGSCWRACEEVRRCRYWDYSREQATCRLMKSRSHFVSDYTWTAGQKEPNTVDCFPL